jgi:hypothetical protein
MIYPPAAAARFIESEQQADGQISSETPHEEGAHGNGKP